MSSFFGGAVASFCTGNACAGRWGGLRTLLSMVAADAGVVDAVDGAGGRGVGIGGRRDVVGGRVAGFCGDSIGCCWPCDAT